MRHNLMSFQGKKYMAFMVENEQLSADTTEALMEAEGFLLPCRIDKTRRMAAVELEGLKCIDALDETEMDALIASPQTLADLERAEKLANEGVCMMLEPDCVFVDSAGRLRFIGLPFSGGPYGSMEPLYKMLSPAMQEDMLFEFLGGQFSQQSDEATPTSRREELPLSPIDSESQGLGPKQSLFNPEASDTSVIAEADYEKCAESASGGNDFPDTSPELPESDGTDCDYGESPLSDSADDFSIVELMCTDASHDGEQSVDIFGMDRSKTQRRNSGPENEDIFDPDALFSRDEIAINDLPAANNHSANAFPERPALMDDRGDASFDRQDDVWYFESKRSEKGEEKKKDKRGLLPWWLPKNKAGKSKRRDSDFFTESFNNGDEVGSMSTDELELYLSPKKKMTRKAIHVKRAAKVIIGRNSPDINIHKDIVSEHHAVIQYDHGRYYIMDTQSTNGTYIDSQRLEGNESKRIEQGSEINFGGVIYYAIFL